MLDTFKNIKAKRGWSDLRPLSGILIDSEQSRRHPGGQILTGPQFSEQTVRANGSGAWVAGLVGRRSRLFRQVVPEIITRFIAGVRGDAALTLRPVGGMAYTFDPGTHAGGMGAAPTGGCRRWPA